MIGFAVCAVEAFRVSVEGAQTGVGAEEDRSAAVIGAWEIGGISVVEDSPAKRDEVCGANGQPDRPPGHLSILHRQEEL